jgi:hypothetical protein
MLFCGHYGILKVGAGWVKGLFQSERNWATIDNFNIFESSKLHHEH